ncbi:MAG TPA: hypothetical protein VGG02_09975 [Chthoniobacterales bacterium]|jgi:hypothetical protein
MNDKKTTADDYTGWPGDKKTRKQALVKFLDTLKGNPTLLQQCCDHKNCPDKAKDTFLSAGGYTNAPADVEVRVFNWLNEDGDNAKEEADKLVTLVLPARMQYNPDTLETSDVWVCTYIQYNKKGS